MAGRGERHSKNQRDYRRGIAEETLQILAQGGYTSETYDWVDLGPAMEAAIEGSFVLYESDPAPKATSTACVPTLEVTQETSLEAVYRLAKDPNCMVLNFASAKNPGGGFLNGAEAQEESLARSSGLFPCLERFKNDLYAMNRRDPRDGLYSDDMIFSPRVPFFREDKGALLPQPVPCSVLTAPAPNAGVAGKPPKELRDVLRERMERMLRLAAAEGAKTLILGAWGCGVFRNDPEDVARLFQAALKKPGLARFQHVVFAIPDAKTHAHFAGVFGAQAEGRPRVVSVDVDAEAVPISLISFGYARGRGVPEADCIFDCRHIPNPQTGPQRQLSGLDARLRKEVMSSQGAEELLAQMLQQTLARDRPTTVAVGCESGKHRSVTFCEELARALRGQRVQVTVSHREQDTWTTKRWRGSRDSRGYREFQQEKDED